MTVYCLSVFSSVALPSFETTFSEENQTEGIHFTEISQLLFPQTINADGNGVSVVHVYPFVDSGIDKAFIATQFLCKLTMQYGVNYFKEFKSLVLQFRTEDIIYPFHNFW